jgi:hypothetical protein
MSIELLFDFLRENATLLVAVLALLISMRANQTSKKVHMQTAQINADNRETRFGEKKRECLNELDLQHAKLASLSFVIARKIKFLRSGSLANEEVRKEEERLMTNLRVIAQIQSTAEVRRSELELIPSDTKLTDLDSIHAKIRQTSIHMIKDLEHETSGLDTLQRSEK